MSHNDNREKSAKDQLAQALRKRLKASLSGSGAENPGDALIRDLGAFLDATEDPSFFGGPAATGAKTDEPTQKSENPPPNEPVSGHARASAQQQAEPPGAQSGRTTQGAGPHTHQGNSQGHQGGSHGHDPHQGRPPHGSQPPPPWSFFTNPNLFQSWISQGNPFAQGVQPPSGFNPFQWMQGFQPPGATPWQGQNGPFPFPMPFFPNVPGGQANPFSAWFGSPGFQPPPTPDMGGLPFTGAPAAFLAYWQQLLNRFQQTGFAAGMPWANPTEGNQTPGGGAWQQPQPGPDSPHSPLITLRAEGNRPPLFCVHALLGSAFQFHKLANLLPEDQPCFALQARGLDTGEKPLDNIEALAALYLKHIRAKQARGPYRLVGYSLGAWISLEIARLLQGMGEQTEMLLMIGGTLPISMHFAGQVWSPEYLQKYLVDYRETFITSFLPYEERIRIKTQGFNPTQQVYLAHISAILSYRPQPFRGGRVAVLATPDQQWIDQWVNPNGWREIFTEPVAFYPISGNHLSMMETPHIDEVAAVVRQQLEAL
ncbi:alpha/beta fold hydrolase [Acanthopleuribacter pedis]|uniref:Alpha/beta fold hydrolase n=1 Tax=Acanthopleuribacter pedis TaxID=442870 RepID=A0A8J7Q9D0_9BACT|nr:alpha/beta fold hydrolase [Acanthopleuribacter pedis]MBO1319354.1 alpha/beta fold hydrolase [Acanthopleuribacter pedis]